jgi:exopolysaccharide biosynthesis protein
MDKNLIDISDTHSDKIEVYSIESAFLKGKLMVIHDPSRVILGYSNDIPDSGKTTSQIVRDFEGIAGINAGGFLDINYAGNGGVPDGYIIHDGEVVFSNMPDWDARPFVGIDYDGTMILGWDYTFQQVLNLKLKEAINFGPPLILNGQKTIVSGDGGWGVAPRTAIGQRKTGEILLLVLDGRSGRTIGATLRDSQDILYEHGAVNAVNLDGGASTTMVYKNKVINIPSDAMGERSIPSAFVVLPPFQTSGGAVK